MQPWFCFSFYSKTSARFCSSLNFMSFPSIASFLFIFFYREIGERLRKTKDSQIKSRTYRRRRERANHDHAKGWNINGVTAKSHQKVVPDWPSISFSLSLSLLYTTKLQTQHPHVLFVWLKCVCLLVTVNDTAKRCGIVEHKLERFHAFLCLLLLSAESHFIPLYIHKHIFTNIHMYIFM